MDRYDEHREHIYEIVDRDMTNLFEGWSRLVDSGKAYESEIFYAVGAQYGYDLAEQWQIAYRDRL